MRASIFSASEPLPAATFSASAKLLRIAWREYELIFILDCQHITHLDRKVFQRGTLHDVNRKLVVWVDGSESAGDYVLL